jgi:ABC-type multidrug transport system fused ATPase/permease subunit
MSPPPHPPFRAEGQSRQLYVRRVGRAPLMSGQAPHRLPPGRREHRGRWPATPDPGCHRPLMKTCKGLRTWCGSTSFSQLSFGSTYNRLWDGEMVRESGSEGRRSGPLLPRLSAPLVEFGSKASVNKTSREALTNAAGATFRRASRLAVKADGRVSERKGFLALKDVSLEVEHGEVLGIIGRNGAGTSALLKILSRITEPTEGRIRIRGQVASLLEVGRALTRNSRAGKTSSSKGRSWA